MDKKLKDYEINKYFHLWEFMPKKIYKMFFDRPYIMVGFIDRRIIDITYFLRERFDKPVIVNTWKLAGTLEHSGYRDPYCKEGVGFSQHKFGRAVDIKIPGMEPEEIRNDIRDEIKWPQYKLLGISTIEKDTPTWIHIDCRFVNSEDLIEISQVKT